MVTFKETISRSLVKAFEKSDIEGYVVVGNATYNKDNKLTDANANIRDEYGKHIADFRAFSSNEARFDLTNCVPEYIGKAAEIAQATLADLSANYPQE